MKTALIRLIIASLTAISLTSIHGGLLASSLQGKTIIIVQRPTTPDEPRCPMLNPFVGELMDSHEAVLLSVTHTCGTVYVQMTSTAGDDYSTYFVTSNGAILLPISGNSGDYFLTIILSNGTIFDGEFTL